MARRAKSRRGVLLLIVLSLLVLFLMIGMTFLVSAGQFNRLAKSAARTDNQGMPGNKLADSALYQILRGTRNPHSAIQGHSLLEDLYGRDYLVGQTTGAVVDYASGHQMQAITFSPGDATTPTTGNNWRIGGRLAEDASDNWFSELQDDYYSGCVLTYLNGTAKGQSTRVLYYKPSQGLIVTKGVLVGQPPVAPAPLAGESNLRFIINGRPFNGTGAGYNPATGRLNNAIDLPSGTSVPVAFLPGYKSYREIAASTGIGAFADRIPNTPGLSRPTDFNYGGLDESWDAVDYQNMFLAKAVSVADLENAATMLQSGGASGSLAQLLNVVQNTGSSIPSFHRPWLSAFMQQQLESDGVDPALIMQLQRAVSLRPSTIDHPSFTGSNPGFDPVFGPWDVDNTGEGIPDSVWVDMGLSPVAGKDGRMYKPLVAAHVIDMDGRINVNAADGLERSKTRSGYYDLESLDTRNSGVAPAQLSVSPGHPNGLGIGYGPADINITSTHRLIRKRYTGSVKANFKDVEVNTFVKQPNPRPPFFAEEMAPGQGPTVAPNNADPIGSNDNRRFETRLIPRIANNFVTESSLLTGYGSPTDLQGRMIPYLDAHGNIVWGGHNHSAGQFDDLDDPYELNLIKKQPFDSPYTLSDLEAICRADFPYQNSGRKALGIDAIASQRNNFTTHSFSIPAPPTINNQAGRLNGEGLRRSMRDVFAARIKRTQDRIGRPMSRADAFERAATLMAPEFARGEKLDINRVLVPNVLPTNTGSMTAFTNLLKDEQRKLKAKETFARHLFNLMMLSVEDTAGIEINNTTETANFARMAVREAGGQLPPAAPTPNAALHKLLVRRIAQWCINVVDFGDADSVMTRFIYDINPFDSVNPVPQVVDLLDRNQPLPPGLLRHKGNTWDEVWGMEHPELVLTESLAFHDRRARDTDSDNGIGQFTSINGGTDPNLDSPTPPQGSVFFELFCTRAQSPPATPVPPGNNGANRVWQHYASKPPEDLYNPATAELNLGVRLRNSAKPVWRLAISEITKPDERTALKTVAQNRHADVQGPQVVAQTFEPADLGLDVRRFIWFCDSGPNDPRFPNSPPGVPVEETAANTYFNRTFTPDDPTQAPIPPARRNGDFVVNPGDFLLVGPRDVTPVGLEKSNELVHSEQEIKLVEYNGNTVVNANALHTRPNGRAMRTVVNPFARPGPAGEVPSQRVVPMIAQTANDVGCSISEPTDGSWYYDPPSGPEAAARADGRRVARRYASTKDVPVDDDLTPSGTTDAEKSESAPLYSPPAEDGDDGEDGGGDEGPASLLATGTQPDFRTVFLQRLANPSLPWHPVTNPYRTLDWMPIDLTVFNSLEDDADDPTLPQGGGAPDLNNFASREKAGGNRDAFNIFSAVSRITPAGGRLDGTPGNAVPTAAGTLTDAANTTVRHTLGWLNRSFDRFDGVQDGMGHFRVPKNGGETEYYLEAPLDQANQFRTYPNIVWLNRPYANPHELMLVPATSNARLSTEFSIARVQYRDARMLGTFGHLLNFQSGSSSADVDEPNFHHIFDFLTVPSRFAGTEEWLNTNLVQKTASVPGVSSHQNPYWNPKNNVLSTSINPAKIPEFREPGRVNLNTSSHRVLKDVGFDSSLRSHVLEDTHIDFMQTMALKPLLGDTADTLRDVAGWVPDGSRPSQYVEPQRAGVAADLVGRWPGSVDTTPSTQATLLRSEPTLVNDKPNFSNAKPVLSGRFRSPSPNSDVFPAYKLQNRDTNPYFRYKDLIKLSNSVTSQSNVYAIWVTIGYFEIEPNYPKLPNGSDDISKPFHVDEAHPDGYRYGIEMGSDLGQVTRHRSFYIVDRSIPVAFEPGANHNVDKAVLVRRHLE